MRRAAVCVWNFLQVNRGGGDLFNDLAITTSWSRSAWGGPGGGQTFGQTVSNKTKNLNRALPSSAAAFL